MKKYYWISFCDDEFEVNVSERRIAELKDFYRWIPERNFGEVMYGTDLKRMLDETKDKIVDSIQKLQKQMRKCETEIKLLEDL